VNTRPVARGKYLDRPAPCPDCNSPAWWNGSRTVSQVRRGADGSIEHQGGEDRRRARCPDKDCTAGSWTQYDGDAYPHRIFRLDVVVDAVAQVAVAGATLTEAAAQHLCSRDSVRRWVIWIEGLADPVELNRLCMRIDPDGLPGGSSHAGPVSQILQLFERLADLLSLRGVSLSRCGSGLARVLGYQLGHFRDVFPLTKSSPPMRTDSFGIGV
jgi:hypothetical protein